MAIYGALIPLTLIAAHLVFPLAMPLTAALLVLVGTTIWSHLTAHQRLMLLEQDMLRLQQEAAAVREALVLRETRAETLQEDLAVARAGITQSTGQQEELTRSADVLRSQLADAQAQEDDARRKLQGLEHQLHGLRAATSEPFAMGDVELDRLRDECRQLGIITQDQGLLRLYRDLKKGAKSPLTVLVLGEPGTGKELFARAVHRLSPRAGKTFIAVNMAAISPELFESELFGHTRGSFTGAMADRKGYFELANHGTIFLDEIGDLRLEHQSKLLRVLQEKSFYRVGATIPTTVDVRIVAATNRDLQRGVSEGWFREDLYFRLTGLVFRLPPLRERIDDVPILAEIFLTEIAGQMACNVLIIEDEPLIALEVAEVASAMGHTVQHVARTHREAIAAVVKDRPDLVLADIKLADGSSGIEAVQEILSSITVPVVFITAYPERLLTGERPEPTYLVEKPFQPEKVKALIAQALFQGSALGT